MDRMPVTPETAILRRADSLVTRRIADETFIIPVRGELASLQRIFSLNQVGAFVWDRLDGEHTLETVCDAVVAHFEVEVEQAMDDLRTLVRALEEAQLVVLTPAPSQ
jgi:hypothetical protein